MKILFLDCDGVLNGRKDFEFATDNAEMNPLNPGSCALLREVLDKTGAKVVFSSVWRRDDSDHGWRKVVRTVPLRFTWEDSDLHDMFKTPVLRSGVRGEEIQRWLDIFGEGVTKYAIIDDDSDMLEHQKPFFTHTENRYGMQQKHADQLVDLLKD